MMRPSMTDIYEYEMIEYMDVEEIQWIMHEYYSGYPIGLTNMFNTNKCGYKLYMVLPFPFNRYACTHDGIVFDYLNIRYLDFQNRLVDYRYLTPRTIITDMTRHESSREVQATHLQSKDGTYHTFIIPDMIAMLYLPNPNKKLTTYYLGLIHNEDDGYGSPTNKDHFQNIHWY